MQKVSRISEKQDIKENQKETSITKVIQNNYAWIIAGLTFFGVIVSNVLKFIEFITSETYFWYFGIDHNLYNYSDKNFIYGLCLSIIFILAFVSVFYCFKQIGENIKKKKWLKWENLINTSLILISNLYIIITTPGQQNLISIIITVVILIIFEFIMSLIFFKKEKESTQEQLKRDLINYIKVLPFIIIFLIIMNSSRIYLNLTYQKQYKIINDNRVIVYSTNDYYITLDCDINNNEIVIYNGSQEKIENNNVKSQLTKFNKVEMK